MAKDPTTAPIETQAQAADQAQNYAVEPPTSDETPDTRQLLREAAWRQMFGQSQEKNPFAR